MTPRTGPAKSTRGESWRGRLDSAQAFKRDAHKLVDLHEEGENANGIVVLMVMSAIAYGDALTDRFAEKTNSQDHSALPKLVATSLGARSDKDQIKRLQKIINEKDAASYGARTGQIAPAKALLDQLDRFAEWVETVIASK